jgi:vacuolar-type H+-ATPase subunit E/Vma4
MKLSFLAATVHKRQSLAGAQLLPKRGVLMGFEELASQLHKHAEAEGKKAIHASQKAAEKIIEAAKEKADSIVKAARAEATVYSKQEAAERITSAKLSAKKMIDEARQEAVERCLSDVWEQFKANALKKSNYPAILQRLVREGIS